MKRPNFELEVIGSDRPTFQFKDHIAMISYPNDCDRLEERPSLKHLVISMRINWYVVMSSMSTD